MAFAVGFRPHGSVLDGLAAFAFVLACGFAFEALFITCLRVRSACLSRR